MNHHSTHTHLAGSLATAENVWAGAAMRAVRALAGSRMNTVAIVETSQDRAQMRGCRIRRNKVTRPLKRRAGAERTATAAAMRVEIQPIFIDGCTCGVSVFSVYMCFGRVCMYIFPVFRKSACPPNVFMHVSAMVLLLPPRAIPLQLALDPPPFV